MWMSSRPEHPRWPRRWRAALRRRAGAWLERRLPATSSVTLNQARIFILPSRQGLALLVVAVLVLLLAINFESSLNYALGFWLIAMLWAAVHLTYRNLSGLTLKAQRAALVEAGQPADYQLVLSSDSRRHRGPVEFIHADWGLITASLEGDDTRVTLSRPTARRGRQPLPRFRLESRYPFGLVVAWSHVLLDLSAWAYPAPLEREARPVASGRDGQASDDHYVQAGTEDFHALRAYAAGDPLHRLHWPAFARDQLVVKAFADYQASDQWLDWQDYAGLAGEDRLAALAGAIRRCLAEDRPFGLRLPGLEIAPAKGPIHTERCRRALAEFGADS